MRSSTRNSIPTTDPIDVNKPFVESSMKEASTADCLSFQLGSSIPLPETGDADAVPPKLAPETSQEIPAGDSERKGLSPRTRMISVASLNLVPKIQTRAAINQEAVEDYYRLFKKGITFPPVKIVENGAVLKEIKAELTVPCLQK